MEDRWENGEYMLGSVWRVKVEWLFYTYFFPVLKVFSDPFYSLLCSINFCFSEGGSHSPKHVRAHSTRYTHTLSLEVRCDQLDCDERERERIPKFQMLSIHCPVTTTCSPVYASCVINLIAFFNTNYYFQFLYTLLPSR